MSPKHKTILPELDAVKIVLWCLTISTAVILVSLITIHLRLREFRSGFEKEIKVEMVPEYQQRLTPRWTPSK